MKIKTKNQTIDSKEGVYCIHLPIRECVDTYDRLTFFERDFKGAEVCCIGGADNMVGIVQFAKDLNALRVDTKML